MLGRHTATLDYFESLAAKAVVQGMGHTVTLTDGASPAPVQDVNSQFCLEVCRLHGKWNRVVVSIVQHFERVESFCLGATPDMKDEMDSLPGHLQSMS